MLLQEYLQDPCRKLSIPYWKNKSLQIPDNMRIVHHDDFDKKLFSSYHDEKYFRLIHKLNNVQSTPIEGFSVRTADASDIAIIVNIINKSYTDLSVTMEQILSYTKTEVYDKNLWIIICESNTQAVGCGIADFDNEAKEGILEWIQVLPEYRGRGIGKMIVNELLCRMKNADFATVSGKIDNSTNPEKLYRSCNFMGTDIWHILTK